MSNQQSNQPRRHRGILTPRRTVDALFIVLFVVGILFLIEQLVYGRSEREILQLLGKILGYASLPLGLLIRFGTWVFNSKNKIDNKFESVGEKLDTQTNRLEVISTNQSIMQTNLDQLEDRLVKENRELDIRMNRLEAKQEVSLSVGETKQQLLELANRFSNFIDEYRQSNK